jgi:hypothetical protein
LPDQQEHLLTVYILGEEGGGRWWSSGDC